MAEMEGLPGHEVMKDGYARGTVQPLSLVGRWSNKTSARRR